MSDPTTPREIIASLRQQITAMKKEWEEERREIAELRAHAERVGQANGRLVVENDALRKDYIEMGKTALKSEINHYIGSIIMTDEQRKLREAVKKELPERASWAEIYAVYEMVRDRTKEAQP